MLRQDIITAFTRINNFLSETNAQKIIQASNVGGTSHTNTIDPAVIVEAFAKAKLLERDFGKAEMRIMEIYGLSPLLVASFWSELIEGAQVEMIRLVNRGIIYFNTYFEATVELLGRETDNLEVISNKNYGKNSPTELLNVIVLEEKESSTPDRIILMLESIRELYDVSAELLGMSTNSLILSSCDSGSDKSFDFLGAAQIVTSVKEIILSLWDRVVYYREDKLSRNIELLAESLPLLEKINKMRENKEIEPELAELLRRKAIGGIIKFSDAGAIIPEISKNTTHNPRLLMRPEPKLLLPPIAIDAEVIVEPEKNTTKKGRAIKTNPEAKQTKKKPKVNKKTEINDPELAKFLIEQIEEYDKKNKKT